MLTRCLVLTLLSSSTLLAQEKKTTPAPDPYPVPSTVAESMKRAVSYYRTHLSFAGGYAGKWSRDLEKSGNSDRSGATLITIETPGTPTIGHAMLRAYQVTRDKVHLQGAREAAQALLWTQLASGGWNSDHDFALSKAHGRHYRRDLEAGDTERAGRNAHSNLDDDKTQFALLFLLELSQLPECRDDKQIPEAVKFGMEGLLAAQAPNGGWPQGFSGPTDPTLPVKSPTLPKDWPRKWPDLDYTGYYTLNDGNLLSIARLLIRANELQPDQRYVSAVKRLGDFLLLSQCPAPQAGWAQQYNLNMEPAWARKFEPPCISSLETLLALVTLQEIWVETGDDKYLKPQESALKWLESSRLPDGQYARFQELHTNTPLYFVKDTYELTYDDKNMPTHYGFKVDELQDDIDAFKNRMTASREDQLAKRKGPQTEKEWLSKAKGAAKKVVTALSGQNKQGIWTDENMIDAGLFIKHMLAMTNYYEAATKAGPLFEKLRAEGSQ
ncbi:MAG: hypothetical protein JNJ83_07480 [Verrucomicrobiaceae bacterium]|nr:hypothetical protein [Verrucomicrobiaceae bacterium]